MNVPNSHPRPPSAAVTQRAKSALAAMWGAQGWKGALEQAPPLGAKSADCRRVALLWKGCAYDWLRSQPGLFGAVAAAKREMDRAYLHGGNPEIVRSHCETWHGFWILAAKRCRVWNH